MLHNFLQNKILRTLLTACLFLTACNKKDNRPVLITTLKQNLERNTIALTAANNYLFRAMKAKEDEPIYAACARQWLICITQAQNETNTMVQYIRLLKQQLTENEDAGDNPKQVRDVIINQGKDLFEKMLDYKQRMLDIHPEIKTAFEKRSFIAAAGVDTGSAENFYDVFFRPAENATALASLASFENNARLLENEVMNFCYSKCSYSYCGYADHYSTLTGQNSTVLQPGEPLEVWAGMGSFTIYSKPEVTINGRRIATGAEGYAVFKQKTPAQPGVYNIPVQVAFTTQTGEKRVYRRSVTYTVKQ
jgi:hypothetical protein